MKTLLKVTNSYIYILTYTQIQTCTLRHQKNFMPSVFKKFVRSFFTLKWFSPFQSVLLEEAVLQNLII